MTAMAWHVQTHHTASRVHCQSVLSYWVISVFQTSFGFTWYQFPIDSFEFDDISQSLTNEIDQRDESEKRTFERFQLIKNTKLCDSVQRMGEWERRAFVNEMCFGWNATPDYILTMTWIVIAIAAAAAAVIVVVLFYRSISTQINTVFVNWT